MGSTFRFALENIHLDHRTVESIISATFNTINTLSIELWVRHSFLYLKQNAKPEVE